MSSTAEHSLIIHSTEWLNTATPPTAESLRGKVVLVEAFQLLCPGCVSHALPQAQKVHTTFDPGEVAVIGLHSVFEHHDAQGRPEVLQAFTHEYRLTFPIAIDSASSDSPIPQTMTHYGLRGTPSLLLFNRAGELALNHFGSIEDLALGATIGSLLTESLPGMGSSQLVGPNENGCDANGCAIP